MRLGESIMKLSGFESLNKTDSTLNWLPRVRTERKSTPKTRAVSLSSMIKVRRRAVELMRSVAHQFCSMVSAASSISTPISTRLRQ